MVPRSRRVAEERRTEMTGTPAAGSSEFQDSARIESLVDVERVRALFERNTAAQAAVLLNSFIVVLVLWGESSPVRLLSWIAAVWLIAAARVAAGVTYRRSERDAEEAIRWGRLFTIGAALNGIGWGLIPLLLPSGAPLTYVLFLAFVLAGMTAGGALSNASHQPAFLAFTVPALLPVTIAFVSSGGRLQLGMAVMLAVFAVAVTAISRSGGRALAEATRLRFRNADLAEHLATAAAELERRVIERTSQLETSVSREREAERQLGNSIRLASLGTLAAAVAHEVNNPLAYVSSNLTFVREELGREISDAELHAAMLTALDEAATGVDRVKSIVRHLNDGSRGELRAPVERVDLHAALDFSIRIADREIRSRATLVREYGDVPAVMAGHTHLVQVFLNLLLNATESIPDGNAGTHRIRIATRPAASGGEVVVEVADTGCGIPGEHLEQIWLPFFTTKPVGLGSGLGLSICRDILARFGGRISVRSSEGAGSTFTIWLKAAAPTLPS
jgi:signal transduction histidine kinase